ncbi:MAG: hypothetical protein EAX95_07910 [Candidatus Thorarchaeota archaeon]|nr:hypothetical protein [Candidatus Thorarchaeota archaeon]
MSDRRCIHGVWLIERGSGRNLVARAYSGIEIDMDLIAPFLSATHTFIDKASNETLTTVDTETNRYIWEANDHLLFVMVVSKGARIGHMRFLLRYALNEFSKQKVPEGESLANVLKHWHGAPGTFKDFGEFVDEIVSQYEETDDSLMAGKSMDALSVFSHLYRAIMRVRIPKATRRKLVKRIQELMKPLTEEYEFLGGIPVDEAGIDILGIDVYAIPYRALKVSLEELLRLLAQAAREIAPEDAYKDMIFEEAMPYVKSDLQRLQTYAIIDDVIRHLF